MFRSEKKKKPSNERKIYSSTASSIRRHWEVSKEEKKISYLSGNIIGFEK